ncbi:hypothetical protein GCM10008170_36470 [Methylopila capsulata]|uniref:CsbD-like domain-containing protein n=2 Tax=Methylopila capsulata TaxID=61654 RepID=A0A9W6MTV3_9HYPH|nr:hypothetical protein GCM10008170_36470 [Methylopila capsulata]
MRLYGRGVIRAIFLFTARRPRLGSRGPGTQEMETNVDKNRIEGAVKEVKGSVKEAIGKVTGNKATEAEGKATKVEGKVQGAVGKVADKVRDAGK